MPKPGSAPMPSPLPGSRGQIAGAPAGAPGGPTPPGGFMSNLFPAQGSDERYEMVMEMVRSGMAGSQNSSSPLAAFIAPIAGALIGGMATRKHEDAQTKAEEDKKKAIEEMTAAMMGPLAQDPQFRAYIEVMNNPNAPDYLKAMAKAKMEAMLKPVVAASSGKSSGRSSGSRGSSSGGSTKSNTRLYGEYEQGGIMYGRDAYGNLKPYLMPDGTPMTTGAAVTSDPAAPPPADPGWWDSLWADEPSPANAVNAPAPSNAGPALSDDDLINKYIGTP